MVDEGTDTGPTTRRHLLRAATLARSLAAGVLVLGLVVPTVAAAQAPTADELQRELDRTTSDRDALRGELAARRGQLAGAEEELAAVGARVIDARGRLRAAEGQLALAEAAQVEAEAERVAAVRAHARAVAELARTEAELDHQEGRLAQQAVSAYKFGSAGARAGSLAFEMMRRAEDPNELAVGMKQISNVIDAQGATVAEVAALRDQHARLSAEADAARAAAAEAAAQAAEQVRFTEQLRREAATLASEVAAEEARQRDLVAAMRADADQTETKLARVAARESELSSQLAERRRAAEAAEREAAEREAAAAREARRTSGGGGASAGSSGNANAGSAGGPAIPGGVCPVVGAVAGRDFSNDWGYPRSGGRTHQGNDIFANTGTAIVAIDDGVVVRANRTDSGLGGLTVTYRTRDGSEWYNAHLDTVADGIGPGVPVTKGQTVGTVGNSGNARTTPPHNHIGRRYGGSWVNPWPTISPLCR